MEAILNSSDNKIYIKDSFMVKDAIKLIPGRMWNPEKKVWVIPLTIEAIEQLRYIPGKIDPAIIAEYQKLKIIEVMRTEEKAEPIEPMPLNPSITPFQHQIKAYNMALQRNAFAFLMEMGTGKSLAAALVAARRFERGEVKRVLIVCPTSVMPVWAKEFEAVTIPFEAQIVDGTKKKRIEKLNNIQDDKLNIAIINYEITWRIIDELLAWSADMIIADESQKIKSPGAKQSKAMHKLGKVTKYKLILTGTPVQNTPLDFYSQYKFLDDSIFGTSYYAFRNRYAVMGGYGRHQVIGYNNLDELTKKAHSIAFRITREEALDLPEQLDEFKYCELEPEAEKLYDELRLQSYAELSEDKVTIQNVLTKILRLQQITGGFINTDDKTCKKVSSAKLNLLEELIQDIVIDNRNKLVVFARFLPEIDAILKLLNEMEIQYSWITGKKPINERGEEVRKFQEDEACKVFVAQIQTGGLGITLHAASIAILYSLDFNYASYEQAKARTLRIGQKKNCTYIHLLASKTIDEKLMQALQTKHDIAKLVVDDWKQYFE